MAKTFYAQSESPEPTMTVGQLIERLQAHDPKAPVIFRSPLYGCFGSNTAYTIEGATVEALPREELHIPASSYEDDETGELIEREAHTQIFEAWAGVVIR